MTLMEKGSGRGSKRAVGARADESSDRDEGWGWTRGQRVGLGMLVFLLIGILALQWWRRPAVIGSESVIVDGNIVRLPRRVDPNTASVAELSRIPHVGEKMAAKIVAFRELHAAEGAVFRQPEDLGRVEGVGKGTVELLRPYLEFPEQEDTQGALR